MKREFTNRVIRLGMVDTKKYRYIYKECGDHAEIRRLPISELGTTSAYNGGWKTVKVIT